MTEHDENSDLTGLHTHDPLAAPSTVTNDGNRIWLYPERRSGVRSSRRKWLAILLIVFYLAVPYLTIGGEPFFRIDVLASRVSLLGSSFHYTDTALVFFVFAALGLTLFAITAVRGRIWCGYACPQTVFIDWVIRPIEEWIEGGAQARRRLDALPWGPKKAVLKLLKHSAFLIVAAIVANTFIAYFIPPATLVHWITSSPSEHPRAFFFMSLVMGLFFFDLGWFREQFCCFLCPYARFQSVLVDWFTPVVGYDSKRGEPRGKAPQSGDCIDCVLCVRVCPTGIDIRRGLQLECIACERCIDACDSIMSHLKRPQGLIRIASQAELAGDKVRGWFRPRVLIYFGLVAIVVSGLAAALAFRHDVGLTLVRAPGQAFTRLGDGRVSNIFQVHVENNRGEPISLHFEVVSPSGAQIICGGCEQSLPAYESQRLNLVVVFDPNSANKVPLQLRFPATGEQLQAALLHP
jgi:cytochrome c oxidase accessory protein FixG